MPHVLEDSVEGFVSRFRGAAADVVVASRVEGDPLLECVVGDRAIHVLERTGPYLVRSGPAEVILHVECDELHRVPPDDAQHPALDVLGVSRISVVGTVRAKDPPFLVLDGVVPLVVGVNGGSEVEVGDVVRLTCTPPVHGFVVPRAAPRSVASPDEQV